MILPGGEMLGLTFSSRSIEFEVKIAQAKAPMKERTSALSRKRPKAATMLPRCLLGGFVRDNGYFRCLLHQDYMKMLRSVDT